MMNKTANAFRELGVRVDDRVLILMLDVPQFYAVFWGAIKMGAVPIPVNTMLTPEDYEYYLNDSRARVLVVSEAARAAREPDQGGPPLSARHDSHFRNEGRPYSFQAEVPPCPGNDKDREDDQGRRRLLALQLGLDRLTQGRDPFPVRHGSGARRVSARACSG